MKYFPNRKFLFALACCLWVFFSSGCGAGVAGALLGAIEIKDEIDKKNEKPGTFAYLAPAAGATGLGLEPVLSWTRAEKAVRYKVSFGETNPPDFLVNVDDPGSGDNVSLAVADYFDVDYGVTYYWRVTPKTEYGERRTGAVRYFSTDDGKPDKVTGVNPADGTTGLPFRVDFTWAEAAGASYYRVYLGETTSPAFLAQVGGNSASSGLLEAGTIYYWRVDSVNAQGTVAGDLNFFTTGADYPGVATDPYPADGANGLETDLTLEWTGHYLASSFSVYMGYGGNLVFLGNTTDEYYDVSGLSHDVDYAWRIDSHGPGGTTVGEEWSFSTEIALPGKAEGESPSNLSTGISTETALSWTGAANASYYYVYLGTSAPGEFLVTTSSTSVTPSELEPGTTYYWRVDSVNDAGITAGDTWKFRTSGLSPEEASVPVPFNGKTGVNTDAVLSWTAGEGTDYFLVYLGTTSSPSLLANTTSSSFDPGGLGTSTLYYWRVDSVGEGGTTVGETWSFTTLSAAPARPEVISPADNATGVSTDATLAWAEAAGAIYYHVYFGTTAPGGYAGAYTDNSFTPGIMSPGTVYYWRVDVEGPGGTTQGYQWSFETAGALPGKASSPDPAQFSTNVDPGVTLRWAAGQYADGYDVYFGNSSPPSLLASNVTDLSYSPGALAADTSYYWRVDSMNDTGVTSGYEWTFRTAPAGAPPKAANPSPTENATDVSTTKTLSWDASTGATSYKVYFGTSTPPPAAGTTTGTSWTPGVLARHTVYYWRVDCTNSSGTTAGDVWSFTTLPEMPDQTGSPSPLAGEESVSVDSVLSWSSARYADSYSVYFGTSPGPPFLANTTEAEFDPGALSYDTTYYWRVDSVNPAGVTAGESWYFKTAPLAPSAPNFSEPSDGATGVDVEAFVTWMTSDRAESYGVYFGKGDAPLFQGEQTSTSFSPGTMEYYTTYSWRIVAYGPGGNTSGEVWTFRTELGTPGKAGGPSPELDAENVSVTTIISWTPGERAETSEVYFGSTSVPPMVANLTEGLYNPGLLLADTTYYWRVDSRNTEGVTTGDTWYFHTTSSGAPGAAGNPTPLNGKTGVSTDVALSWSAASGAASYRIYIGSSEPLSLAGNSTSTTFELENLSYNTAYYWRVDSVNDQGITSGSTWSFRTALDTPEKVTSPLPSNGATGQSTAVTLSWNTSSGAEEYAVYFGETFPGAYQGRVESASFAPSGLSYGTTYYWRVDSINASGNATGDAWSFTTIEQAPAQATNPSPAPEASSVNVDMDLSWGAAQRADSYDLYFGTSNPPSLLCSTSATSYEPGTLSYDTTYYWRIDSSGEGGLTSGATWSFRTEIGAPPQSGNPSPPHGTADVSITQFLSWTAGERAQSFDVYFGTSSSPPFVATQEGTSFNPGVLEYDATYYWRVDTRNSDGVTVGTTWSFSTVNPGAPAKVTAPEPSSGSKDLAVSTDLGWAESSNATSYEVYFGSSDPPSYQTETAGNSFDPGTLSNDTTYYWRVDAKNLSGVTTGDVWVFRTIPEAPAQVSGASPVNDEIGVLENATLSWNAAARATGYRVYFGTTSPGASQGLQTATTFDPGGLDPETTYYWRVDSVNAAGATTGEAWSFVTRTDVPVKVGSPSPANGQTGVSVSGDLEWGQAARSDYYRVYFGTASPGAPQGIQTETTFSYSGLAYDTTYYWRIDSYNTTGGTEGDVWFFRTVEAPPGKAANPNPVYGTQDVSVNATLSWNAVSGAESYDVYLGVASPGAFVGTVTGTSYDPGGLSYGTTYYWRVDTRSAGGVTTGDVWTFRTEPGLPGNASNPIPLDGQSGVSADSSLSWTAATGAEGYYVFMSDNSPPSYAGTTGSAAFDPGGLLYSTTYYWYVVAYNSAGNSVGPEWSFRTAGGGMATTSWPCFRGGEKRTGLSAFVGSLDNNVKWETEFTEGTDRKVFSSPAIGPDNTVYVGCENGYLYALYPENGGQVWKYDAGGAIYSSPAVASDGTVYVGSDISRLHAVNPDGSEKWTFPTLGYVASCPVIGNDGTIYFGSDDYRVYALKPNGDEKWSFRTDGWVEASPALGNDGKVVYAASFDGKLYALWASNGSEIWSYDTGSAIASTPAIDGNGNLYFGCRDFFFYSVSPTGNELWSYETDYYVDSSPALGPNGSVYFGGLDFFVYAFTGEGNAEWSYETGEAVFSSPAVDTDGVVYIGSDDGYLYALQDGGEVWKRYLGDYVGSSPAIAANGTIYVGTAGGKVFAIRQE